ncbi:HAD-IIB family hydrolase [Flavivirga amylovorans]|uniref:HAD-IIB family hydrolase n=1 Tax=Flavivirga amylovorans TaxID=870486 RepID=A0ABT8X233_9FLAO|nr:HAD-IIB family hydrolase [Flavivirga amylovorans]MDO5987772.1 HAD-IIB family hydrolase [Flavivirga amylovorans]
MYKQSNFSNTIFYSDLDGTLLNNKARLAPKCCTNLKRLIDEGLMFSVASARNLTTIRDMLNGIHLSLPVISLNGAYISDINKMQHIQINSIEKDIKENLSEYIQKNNLGVFISNHQNNKDGILYYGLKNYGEQWYLKDRQNCRNQFLMTSDKLSEVIKSEITCFTFIDRKENLEVLKRFILEHYNHGVKTHLFENQYSKGWFWLTVHSNLATKSTALQFIKNTYGYTDKLLTVFGDGINDTEMFELADMAISVDNAIPAIKEKSDFVIGSNEAGSVVNYLNQLKKQSVEL